MKIKMMQSRVLTFKGAPERISGNTRAQQDSSSSKRPPTHKAIDTPPANPVTAAAPTTKGKDNSYAKPGVGKCYRCGEYGHMSIECPKRRPINMTDYKDEDEVLIKTEPKDSDFVKGEGEVTTCVIQRLLCNQKNPNITQMH